MEIGKDIQDIKMRLIEKVTFSIGCEWYYFNSEGVLAVLEDKNALSYWEGVKTLRSLFGKENSDIVRETLNELQQGDSVDKFIFKVKERKKCGGKSLS